jgi:hypothetical protein
MIIVILNVVLFVLKFIEVLAILAITVLGVDFAYAEFIEWKHKESARKASVPVFFDLAKVAHAEHAAVDKLLEDSRKKLADAKTRDELRQTKTDEAWGGFFNDDYYRGFDHDGQLLNRGAVAPSEPDWAIYGGTEQIAVVDILTNTKEL